MEWGGGLEAEWQDQDTEMTATWGHAIEGLFIQYLPSMWFIRAVHIMCDVGLKIVKKTDDEGWC